MDIKSLLKQKQFTFEKKFGQNFLTDSELLSSIVSRSGVDKNSTVIEIGVGAGTLTSEIAKQVKKVYGYEIDLKLKEILTETLKDFSNIELIFQDIMKNSIQEIEEKVGDNYTVIANLPYYITTPIIMKFIEGAKKCDAIIVTIQKEVALRICAKEGCSDYGAITASINATCDTEIIEYINRDKFYPSPNVDSAVVKIVTNKEKFNIIDIKAYRNLVKNSFLMRRKTLVNNLMKSYNLSRDYCENLLTKLNIDINARGESLSPKVFVELSNELVKNNIK